MEYIKSELNGSIIRLHYLKNTLLFNTTSHILNYIEKMISTTAGETIIIDLSVVDHIDSSAVGMLISIKYELSKLNRAFVLEGLTDNVRRILQILDITNYLCAFKEPRNTAFPERAFPFQQDIPLK
jgi:anti-anti-sigma factor